MKKALLFAVIIAVLVTAGAWVRLYADKGPVVAYSHPGDANSWFKAFSTELETEAGERGYQYRVANAQGKIGQQIADVENIVADKPEFLILGPITPDGSAAALDIAKEAGVPVIVVNRDIDGVAGEDYITKIYSDFDWIGEKLAELTHDAFPAGTKIRIVELHGTQGSANTIGLSRGFRKKMEEYNKTEIRMEIVVSQPGNFNKEIAMKAMEKILQSKVEFDAVFCHFDDEALGAIRAMQDKGIKLGDNPANGEIIVVGNGGTNDGLKAIKDGTYYKIVSVTPYYADAVFDAIESYKKNEKLPDYIRVGDIVIDKSNVDEQMSTAF
ncbi:MAG: substrate-binding domain-containing protein [Planctomycetes bacterium]|nr:substrate-binding domain-containing protein [Planctomycetota bacterium]